MKNKQFKIIAGPCAVESEGQIMAIAKGIANIVQKSDKPSTIFSPIKYLRGGIWKPRTRPNMFEGLGEVALPWLYNAAVKHNMIPITEVGTAAQLTKAMNNGITSVWIGARTSGDPFAVNDICEVLRINNSFKFEVFVKNPLVEDLDLWIGAVERVKAVCDKVHLIYRGTYIAKDKQAFLESEKVDCAVYRNECNMGFVEQMKCKFPDSDLFIDPSHITGYHNYVEPFINEMIRNYGNIIDGFMIETHINREDAITDRNQQLELDQLKEVYFSERNQCERH